MKDQLSIGDCEVCRKTLVPEDFNLRGAIRLPDERVICRECADKAQEAAMQSRVPRRGDTGVWHVDGLKPDEGSRQVRVGCMECGETFDAILSEGSRYIFCPKCGKKMRMEFK